MNERTVPEPSRDSPSGDEQTNERRVAALCRSCDEVYAAEKYPEGRIRPIGYEDGCPCGDAAFTVLD